LANTINFVVKNGITVGSTPVIASNGTYISAISNTGVQPGIYGNTTLIPVITVGADGRVTAISNTSAATTPATASIVTNVDTFTANGTGQTFVLSQTPYNINATIVNINGATQQKSSYTLSGNTITLSEIVPSGVVIEISTNYNAANTGTNSGALVSTVDAFTSNGNTTIFTLSSAPVNKNYTSVNIDGISQQKSTYSITGNVITFSTAPPNGTSVEITAISSQTGAVFTYNTSGTNGQVLTLQSGTAVWANTNLTTSIANTGIVGLITASQIANVANTQITGNITSSQITSIANTQITGVLTTSQGGTGATSLESANIATTTSSTQSLNSVNTFGFKNRIINGGMTINQRGLQTGLGGYSVYTVDRWLLARENGSQAARFTITNTALTSSDTPLSQDGLSYALQANVTTASGGISAGYSNYIAQRIEGFNVADFAWGTSSAKPVTLSFWAKTVNKTGAMSVCLYSSANRNYVQTISMTTSWQKFLLTFPGDTGGSILTSDNSYQLQLMFVLSSGSNLQVTANQWNTGFANSTNSQVDFTDSTSNVVYITGVQLEVGSQATSFDFRDYGRELILCQRYFQKYLTLNGNDRLAIGNAYTSTSWFFMMPLQVSMRASPSFTLTQNGWGLLEGVAWYTVSSLGGATSTTTNVTFQLNMPTTAATATQLVWLGQQSGQTGPIIFLSSEL